MKKFYLRVTAILLFAAVGVGFVSCGDDEGEVTPVAPVVEDKEALMLKDGETVVIYAGTYEYKNKDTGVGEKRAASFILGLVNGRLYVRNTAWALVSVGLVNGMNSITTYPYDGYATSLQATAGNGYVAKVLVARESGLVDTPENRKRYEQYGEDKGVYFYHNLYELYARFYITGYSYDTANKVEGIKIKEQGILDPVWQFGESKMAITNNSALWDDTQILR